VTDPSEEPPLAVACLCAAWCRTCGEYAASFEALAREFPQAQFSWVDVEDQADALGELDIVDFPTLMLARGDRLLYCGPVLPQPGVARQLVARALAGSLPVAVAAGVPPDLPVRLRRLRA
jgi:thioredoxin 1